MVALILVFIFATPRDFFRDQPKSSSIVMLSAGQEYFLEPKLLSGVGEADLAARATEAIRERYKNRVTVTRVEPLTGESDDEVTGYIAIAK